MADDVTLPGTGAVVRAVQKSSKDSQVFILDVGGAGAESLLTTLMPIGSVSVQIDITIAASAAAYSSGDMVGSEVGITGTARVNGGTGKITGLRILDDAVQSVAGELWISDTAVTEPADNAAWSISDADAANNVTVIPISAYYASALNSIAPIPNLSIPFKCTASDTKLYCCWVTRGAPTYTANALHVRIWVDQD